MSGSRRNRFWRGVLMAALEEAAATAGASSAERLLGWTWLVSPASAGWRQITGEAPRSTLVSASSPRTVACLVAVQAGPRPGFDVDQDPNFIVFFVSWFDFVTHSVGCLCASLDMAIIMNRSIFRWLFDGTRNFCVFSSTSLLPGGGLILLFSVFHPSSCTSLFLSFSTFPSSCLSLYPFLHRLFLSPLHIQPSFLPMLCAHSSSVPFFLLLPLLVFLFFFLVACGLTSF